MSTGSHLLPLHMTVNQPVERGKRNIGMVLKFLEWFYKGQVLINGWVMKEVLREANPVKMSFMRAVLADHHIETVVLDSHASSMFPGVGAMEARLMVVKDELCERALFILKQKGLVP